MPDSTATNSSPPGRASVSDSRTVCSSRLAASLQQQVSDVMSQGVVDELETVQVHVEHRHHLPLPPRQREGLPQAIFQQRAVRQAGERIVLRLIRQPAGELPVLQRDGRQFRLGIQQDLFGFGDLPRFRAGDLQMSQNPAVPIADRNRQTSLAGGGDGRVRSQQYVALRVPGSVASCWLRTRPSPPPAKDMWRFPSGLATALGLGRLEIFRPDPWRPTEPELVLMDSMANLASIAVEHRQLTNRLAYQAQHDPLTGLPNRVLLDDRLRQAITLARRQATMVAVLYVDLDRFKFINDTLGHHVGDVLLQQVAKRLEGAMRESDTLARSGGDEFVAVLFGVETVRDAEIVGERIMEAMREPFQIKGHELFVSASVGLSLFPEDGEDTATLQKHADVAMYEAKNRGRSHFQRFVPAMNSASG